MIVNEPLIRITDFNDPRLDIYTRLPEVQLLRYREPKPGIFLAAWKVFGDKKIIFGGA